MKKILSLLKASLSQDMNMFQYNTVKNSNKLKKVLFPIFLFGIVSVSIGAYAYMLAEPLHKVNLTYVMLSMFLTLVTILTFMSGIYKSQGILFDAKDSDLLFSLPIKRSSILFLRIFKLIIFQYIYNLMFLLPAFVVYIIFEKPGPVFYLVSILMTVLIPLIPTVISSLIGYLVKIISSKFKAKKIIQTILSIIVFLIVYILSLRINDFVANIATQATSINDMLTKIYYPIGAYVELITNFKFLTLIKLILICLIPLVIFIYIGSKFYFKVVFNSKEISTKSKKLKDKDFKEKKTPLKALTIKELKRYFSSPVYMFNTCFGLILILIMSCFLFIKGETEFKGMLKSMDFNINTTINLLFYTIILFAGMLTSITSSSISLEGKTINITKSLPVSEKTILNSKILMALTIELPFILISIILFIIKFTPNITYTISLILLGLIVPTLTAIIGLLVNLKYPKLNFSSDTEVVKQSLSSMISIFTGMGITIISIIGIGYFSEKYSLTTLMLIHVILLMIITFLLYKLLMKIGPKEYRKLSI